MKDVAILLHEASGLLRRRFEQAARPEGLTLMQWRALGLLDQQGPLRQVAIGEALEASPMTISDLADRLESAGLVTRATDPSDSRAKVLELTETGATKLRTMRRISEAVFAQVFAGVTGRETAALRQGLLKLKKNLGGAAPSAPEKDVQDEREN
ncbi:MarR family transcriptional regulator [Pseudooceanicola nanhaiensis]|jgi:DNA-binding MarR family transcriptional regulator|uniref:MarR family winged helix-turn-helix transcriptional regulator n=1 Tax=Pseudooceanicola TaxID=1679449 RepID=UPI0030096297